MKAKIHSREQRGQTIEILALCDASLIGKVFESKNAVLDLKTYKAFYDGEKVTEKKAIELVLKYKNLNVVGEKSVKAACKALGLPLTRAKKIGGVPHLQIYFV
ncbi:DUF424 family protein [Candidatus Micrarchaeota archaeon]|nr:DUF424 family protein [Candidatus Micrarchaeota archaeon]